MKHADPETGELEGAQVGEYRLVARMATGGMAEVWLADALGGAARAQSEIAGD
jgi:hypothetical protein